MGLIIRRIHIFRHRIIICNKESNGAAFGRVPVDAFFIKYAYSEPEHVHSVYASAHFTSIFGNYVDDSHYCLFPYSGLLCCSIMSVTRIILKIYGLGLLLRIAISVQNFNICLRNT